MARLELPRPRARKRTLRITLFVVILLALLGARTIASTVIDYQWWKELGQVDTWLSLYLYGFGPLAAAAIGWHDPVFGRNLAFYLFDLPFYSDLRQYVLAVTVVCILVYWIAARIWQLRYRISEMREMREIDPRIFRLEGGLESKFL